MDVDASERSIAHQLSSYLKDKFSDWHADCEYNRDGRKPKRAASGESRRNSERLVVPDIIIHRRGCGGPNLLVIEVKKNPDGKGVEVRCDLDKLKGYKLDFDYTYAVFLKVWTGENAQDPLICWVGEE